MAANRQHGITLIEVVLSVVVISVGMIGVMSLFESATKGALKADVNLVAANLIHEKMEQIVSHKVAYGYAYVDNANYPNETFTGDFSLYARSVNIIEVSASDLETPEPDSGYKLVNVTVSWGAGAGELLTIPTILASY